MKNTKETNEIDITNRKMTEQKLIESEKKYKDLFEKSKDAIQIVHNGKFVDCNQATLEILGYDKKEDFLMKHPSEISPEKQSTGKTSLEKANEMMTIALKNGSHRFEWLHTKSNGKVFPAEVLLTTISNDKNDKTIHAVIRDITERKKAEKKSIRLSSAVEQSPNIVILTDTEGRIIYTNSKFTKTTGYEFEEVKGKLPRILKNNKIYTDIWDTISFGKVWSEEISDKKKDGTIYWEKVIISPVFDENGNIINYLKIAEDITEQKRIKEELKDHQNHLEELVDLRTKEIAKKNIELERSNKIFINREYRINELRKELKTLKKRFKVK